MTDPTTPAVAARYRAAADRLAGALWGVDLAPPDAHRIAEAIIQNDPGIIVALAPTTPPRPVIEARDALLAFYDGAPSDGTDAGKLRALADWMDRVDDAVDRMFIERGEDERIERTMQSDLRRIARTIAREDLAARVSALTGALERIRGLTDGMTVDEMCQWYGSEHRVLFVIIPDIVDRALTEPPAPAPVERPAGWSSDWRDDATGAGLTRDDAITMAVDAAKALAAADARLRALEAAARVVVDRPLFPMEQDDNEDPPEAYIVTPEDMEPLRALLTESATQAPVAGAVWCPCLPPGGWVCERCGFPVESEPCAEHMDPDGVMVYRPGAPCPDRASSAEARDG